MLKLIGRLENFAGLVDASLDWQFMIDLIMEARHARPGFLLISGTELMVSSAAIGATAMFAPLAGIAPNLLRRMYELCRADKLFEARAAQEDIASLRQLTKAGGVASLKAALAARGRDCGAPRPPLQALDPAPPPRSRAISMSSLHCGMNRAGGSRRVKLPQKSPATDRIRAVHFSRGKQRGPGNRRRNSRLRIASSIGSPPAT